MAEKEHVKNPYEVYCETCPIRDNCKPYKEINSDIYSRQKYSAYAVDCPLLKLIPEKDRVYIEFDL